MSSRASANVKSVPFNTIGIRPKTNSRKELRDIPELAKNIEENGLQSALLVTNGGEDGHLDLCAGFRRAAALTKLGWGSKLVNVIVVEDGLGANLIENILREPLPALDLAKRLAEMKAGTYYDPNAPDDENDADSEPVEGETKESKKRKWTNAELAKLLSKSQSHITNFVRVHENLSDETKDLLGPWNPPGRLLFVWAGKSEKKQLEMAGDWIRYMKALESDGRSRKPSGQAGKETSTSSKPGIKVLKERCQQLAWKGENTKGKGAETAALAAGLLRFVLGEGGFPRDLWSGEDTKEYKAAVKAEEAAAEVEEEVEE